MKRDQEYEKVKKRAYSGGVREHLEYMVDEECSFFCYGEKIAEGVVEYDQTRSVEAQVVKNRLKRLEKKGGGMGW